MAGTYGFRDFTLTLDGTVQRLSAAFTDPTVGGKDDLPIVSLVLQPDAANGAIIYVGASSALSNAAYGFALPAAVGGVPPTPFQFSLAGMRMKASEVFVLGTNGQKLHFTMVGY